MPEITVTERQRERLAAIESELDAAYIDTYGCIRTKDVVQYLLDTYTPPEQQDDVAYERIATAEFGALQAVATDVEGVPGSGIDAATMRGELLSALGVETFATRLAEVEGASGAAGDPESGGDSAESDGTDPDPTDAAGETEDASTAESDGTAAESAAETESDDDGDTEIESDDDDGDSETEADSNDDTASTSGSAAAGDGPGAVLSAANQLLTDHEDKWREGGSDSPYEVDLPDGTTENVRTKDDVRGLLFKHY